MTKYVYTLKATQDEDIEIVDIIESSDINSAYEHIYRHIGQLNDMHSMLTWQLARIEHGYVAGLDDKYKYDGGLDEDCFNDKEYGKDEENGKDED